MGPSAVWWRKAIQRHCFGQEESRTQRVETPKRKEKTQTGAFEAAAPYGGSAQGGFGDDVKAPIAEDQARCSVFGAGILSPSGSSAKGGCFAFDCTRINHGVKPTWDVRPDPSPDCHALRFPSNCKYERRAICIFDIN